MFYKFLWLGQDQGDPNSRSMDPLDKDVFDIGGFGRAGGKE